MLCASSRADCEYLFDCSKRVYAIDVEYDRTREKFFVRIMPFGHDKLTYVVQILSSIDGLISISDRRTKKIDLDQFVMPTTERGRNMSLKRFGF